MHELIHKFLLLDLILRPKSFLYSIKVADFYYKDTAKIMVNRIKDESSIKNLTIIELSKTKYRVLIGPFNDIKSLKGTFEKMSTLNFLYHQKGLLITYNLFRTV